MNKKIICEGNDCKCSVFTYGGCVEITIIMKDDGEDECSVIYEDGLYKLIKNGVMVIAATSVLIRNKDLTK